MTGIETILLLLAGAIAGFMTAWLLVRPNSAVLNTRLSLLQQELNSARGEAAKTTQLNNELNIIRAKLETAVEAERKANEEKKILLDEMAERLRESFQALSADALKSNNEAFLQLA